MVKIVFVNKDLPRTVRFKNVEGLSGKVYAIATLTPNGEHVSTPFSIPDYDKVIEDIMRNSHRPFCRWIPRVLEASEVQQKPETPTPSIPAPTLPATYDTEPPSPPQSIGLDLLKLPFFKLQKVARDKGVNPEGLKKPAIIEAILAAK